ncbi:shikimate dehydrogenase [Parablautia muri]|uniref:shikimate dehydrogenase n=1 Tax=Parablautia muri TaxID=2320879 RepID=UPI0024124D1A|nr:shikimate dehydrogenase [Parablautia muri]
MEINGHTRTCGLIGNPVEHTMSPLIHNTLAQKLSRNLVYVPFHVEQGQVADAVKGAYALNVLGLNVTVPYKSEVIAGLSQIDELAQKIGAVNTLVRVEDGFKGYNTDMPGLYRAMCSEGIELEGEDVVLLGAGGAARAVAFLCASKNVSRVYLLNRSVDKAQAVAKEVNEKTGKECIYPMALADYRMLPDKKFLAIQATSVGLYPDVDKAVIENRDFYQKIHTGYDLIYKPLQTKFMKLVKDQGGNAFHGLKMLLYQGIIAYELWNQLSVSEEMALEVYEILKENWK